MNSDQKMQVIKAIRKENSRNEKKNILVAHPELKNMLHSTYNPFIHYNIEVPDTWRTTIGANQFGPETNQLLNQLAYGGLSGNAAKKAIKDHLTTLTWESQELLLCILNKDMRMGLHIKSINEVFPGLVPTHDIQLAHLFREDKVKFPCLISPKLDGLRAIFREGKFYSRNGNIFSGLDHLAERIQSQVIEGVVLDGELTVEGEHFNEISGKIRSFDKTDNAVYNMFDIPTLEVPLHQRLTYVDALANQVNHPSVQYVMHRTVTTLRHIHEFNGMFIEQGYEGSIVKNENALYIGSRTFDWMKIKSVESEDLKVVGVFEGQGKYFGSLGGIIVDRNGVQVRVGSGLTDVQRNHWADYPEEVIGKTAEVLFQEVTPDGSLRHPRLKTLRGDK